MIDRRRPLPYRRSTGAAGLVALTALLGCLLGCQGAPPLLVPDREVAVDLSAGAATFRFAVEAEDYVELAVRQHDADVELAVRGPEGRPILEGVDSFLDAFGTERARFVATTSGAHHLVVRPLRIGAGGRITARLHPPRPANAADRRRIAAQNRRLAGLRAYVEGDAARALRLHEEALDLWRDLGEVDGEAGVRFALAVLHRDAGHRARSRRHFERVLALAGDALDLQAMTQLLLGNLDLADDRLDSARRRFEEADALWSLVEPQAADAALTLTHLGLVLRQLGEVTGALRVYDLALRKYRALGRRDDEAIVEHNRGMAFAFQRDFEAALASFRQASQLQSEAASPDDDLAASLSGAGHMLLALGATGEAREHFERALALRRPDDRRGRAFTLAGLGQAHAREGRREPARRLLQECLELYEAENDPRNAAVVLRLLGELAAAAGDLARAGELLARSFELARGLDDRDGMAASRFGLARLEHRRGRPEAALALMDSVLAQLEALRRQPPDDAAAELYLASKQRYFDFMIDLLMELDGDRPQAGYAARALAVSERARARALLDLLSRSGIDLRRGSGSELLARGRELELRIAALRHRLTAAGSAEREALDPLAGARARDELRGLLAQLAALEAETRTASPAYSAVAGTRRPLSVSEIQEELLDPRTLLLHYQLGDARGHLWALDKDRLTSLPLPGRAVIEEQAERFHSLLSVSDGRKYRDALERSRQELSRLLLVPVADQLARVDRLLIVAEGSLHLVPFSALATAEGAAAPLLVEGQQVVHLPSASILAALRAQHRDRPPPTRGVAVLADPVFRRDDERFPGGEPALPPPSTRRSSLEGPSRLPDTGLEARSILALDPRGSHFQALGFDATKERALSRELRLYRYLHFATHGELDLERPERSKLLFSLYDPDGNELDGELTVEDIYAHELRAEMVVLSACETALGRRIQGEGIVGWTHGFLYAGAQRVLVSLWPVDDRSTAELMRVLYTHLLRGGDAPAAALRKAQDAVRRTPGWEAPYYWAGWVLQGEVATSRPDTETVP